MFRMIFRARARARANWSGTKRAARYEARSWQWKSRKTNSLGFGKSSVVHRRPSLPIGAAGSLSCLPLHSRATSRERSAWPQSKVNRRSRDFVVDAPVPRLFSTTAPSVPTSYIDVDEPRAIGPRIVCRRESQSKVFVARLWLCERAARSCVRAHRSRYLDSTDWTRRVFTPRVLISLKIWKLEERP